MDRSELVYIIHAKIVYLRDNRWTGYLTPTEILTLFDNGALPINHDDIDRAKQYKASGNMTSRWFDFSPTDLVKGITDEIKR